MAGMTNIESNRIVCDFCSDPKPEWSFPCKNFRIGKVGDDHSEGPWAACETCYSLILRADYRALGMRSAKHLSAEALQGVRPNALLKSFRTLHEQFQKNRTGPPRRLTEAEKRQSKPGAKSK